MKNKAINKVLEHIASMKESNRRSSFELHRSADRALLDAMRDTAILVGLVYFILVSQPFSAYYVLLCVAALCVSFACWRAAREALYSWAYLERIHCIAYEERSEIVNHREQERQELLVLYQEKGFSGPLLEKVVDVLMADHERLLQVMLQEEMGVELTLIDHPLYVAGAAFLGVVISSSLSLAIVSFCSLSVSWLVLAFFIGALSLFLAHREKNCRIKAFVWSFAVCVCVFEVFFFLSKLVNL